jgi:FixJ family two-component response regulator
VPFPKGQGWSGAFSVIVNYERGDQFGRAADSRFMQTRKKVVAVVDDDQSMLNAAENLLDAHGFTTMKFPSAEEFLGSGEATRADCLLVDIHLGGVSGIELRRQLKVSHPELPVIFMTALDDEAVRCQALEAGCVTFLHKPFPAHQLIEAIKRAVPH